MIRLLLVRHAETAWRVQQRFQGQTDIPLNQHGRQQAAALAEALRTETVHTLYSSDLSRAWETAEALASTRALVCHQEPRLREVAFGDWEGLTYADIAQRDPDLLAAWQADPLHQAPPNGETLTQMTARVHSVLTEISAAHPEQTVLIVSHAGPLRVLLCLALGLAPQAYWHFSLPPASFAELGIYAEGAILSRLIPHADLSTSVPRHPDPRGAQPQY